MKPYSTFLFDSYTFNPKKGEIRLNYSLDDEVHFTETLTLQKEGLFPDGVDKELLERALFSLHLIGGISYYKTCCPGKIEIRSGKLTKEQAEFWNTVYTKGLGEFFYRNNLDFEGLVQFPSDAQEAPKPISREKKHERVLVPIGGGKDSVVTVELLKAAGLDCVLFRLGRHPFIDAAAKAARLPMISVERKLPRDLFQMNAEGALNGHVPVSAYLCFLSTVAALLYGFDYIAMSCERSASEGNVDYKGHSINHQWSKSLEFERMFQHYIATFLTPDVECFSVLRTMSELHIAQHFCALPQYFPLVTSCNANWKILGEKPEERWCGTCPKCAFAFCQFAAFLPKKALLHMFQKNLYEEEALLPLYRQLLGLEGIKPFECVGTPQETRAAMHLALEGKELNSTPVLRMFTEETSQKKEDLLRSVQDLLTPANEHAVSPTFFSHLHAHR
ncbi:hypothetical protein COU76_01700 [Candidatus Peregrinibacteria bacterium CG10_big_fil_rev_8_21_14_0_10_49_10]|nr:MAG: hypothetical protein COU76_01700 [Candidatus Peregrinibacteria bacterium CG10_big_fil_rev_8_21_14_0_10_49_10]